MNRTMWQIIGLLLSIIAIGLALYKVTQTLK
jgi:uncharacterized membrane protein